MYQVLTSWWEICNNQWKENLPNLQVVNNWIDVDSSNIILCQGDLAHANVKHWLNNDFPVLYFARGYVGNHQYKSRDGWMHRITQRGWANFDLKPIPHSRWPALKLEKHNWKVKKVKNVLIAPSKATTPFWSGCTSTSWAEEISKKFPGANIKIRYKTGKSRDRWNTLFKDFDWADLVVSQSSAITAEAFWYGKKVISTEPCTTWAVGRPSVDDWQNPKEPELRDRWHEHVAWSQFTNTEIDSGEAIMLVQQYHGSVLEYKHNYKYNFFLKS
jgi:hypothetical protein